MENGNDDDDMIPPEYLFGPRYRSASQIQTAKEPTQTGNRMENEDQGIMDENRRNKYRDNPYYDQLNSQHYEQIETHKILFLSGKDTTFDPRKQSYGKMLKLTCCPVWKLASLSTACLLIYIGIFIAEAVIGLNIDGTLLQIDLNTLILFGANNPYLVRQGEVWRLVVAAVLHIDFNHLLGNAVSTIILLSHIEYTIGAFRSFILYFVTAVGANIFSALCAPDATKAGASTCLFGGVGFTVGYFVINWRGLNRIGPIMKCQLGCITFMIVVFTAAFTSVGENVDYFGHLGGLITGIWTSMIYTPLNYGRRQTIIRGIFGIILIAQLAITFILFFNKDPNSFY